MVIETATFDRDFLPAGVFRCSSVAGKAVVSCSQELAAYAEKLLAETYTVDGPGAALLSGLGTGYYRDASSACASVQYKSRVFAPDPQRTAHYGRLYREVYARLYGDLHAVNAALAAFPREAC